VTVGTVADALTRLWGGDAAWERDEGEHPSEAAYLRLDCSNANIRLQWQPVLALEEALSLSVAWYREFNKGLAMRDVSLSQIDQVLNRSATLTAVSA
jgi:CDP-glucose 4,6-dehydratase